MIIRIQRINSNNLASNRTSQCKPTSKPS